MLPIAVCGFLLQSYFWVPTYKEQARATPERLNQYITASIGDAEILNPILNSDTASSGICDQVFEGLIDRDRDLSWRARLAKRWEIFEWAYFVVNPADGRAPEQIAELIRSKKAKHNGEDTALAKCLRNITRVEIQPAETLVRGIEEDLPSEKSKSVGEAPDEEKEPERVEVRITVRRPPRIKLTLRDVDQDLFVTLRQVLREGYFSTFDGAEYVDVRPAAFASQKEKYARRFLPPTEHNPIILFHLRRGVKFHDGHEFDAGDVKFTYESIMNIDNLSPRVPDYEPVKFVEVVDKYTVRVVYKRLYSPGFSTWQMGILPEPLLNEEQLRKEAKEKRIEFDKFNMRKSSFNRHPLGCGPYRFDEWQSDEYIKLTRFNEYWEGATEYEKYIFRIIPDTVTQEMEFYAGAIDGYGAQPNQAERLKKDPRFQSFSGLGLGYVYIGYNMRNELFKDRRVRRALTMAINIDDIIEYVRYGQAERITGPFPKQTDFYDHGVEPIPFNPRGALKLLQQAGWKLNPNGVLEKGGKKFRFTLITNNGNRVRKDVSEVAQHFWKKLGIDVDIELIEWTVFLKHIDTGDFDACVLGWSMGLEPDLYQIWHSSQCHPHQLNFVAFKNQKADDLIIRIRREYDKQKQAELCHELHRIIAREQPYTFLFVGRWTALLDKRIVVARRDPSGHIVGYRKIRPTKLGSYTFNLDRWVKLPQMPEFLPE